jgi:hypothetical protein
MRSLSGAESRPFREQVDLFIIFGMLYRPMKMCRSQYITLRLSTHRNELVRNGSLTSIGLV